MRVQDSVLVARPPADLYRYLSDPRHVLSSPAPMLDYELMGEPGAGRRRYQAVSRLAQHERWDIELEELVPGRRMRIDFGRQGKPRIGWFEYDLEPLGESTLLRTTGEIRLGLVIRLLNAVVARFRSDRPSQRVRALEEKISRWLAAEGVDRNAASHEPAAPHDPDGKVMATLLAACPSFTQTWDPMNAAFPRTHGRGVYSEVGEFAGHLVVLLDRGQTGEFEAVFGSIEQLLQDPDDSVRYLTKVGLLEDIGNIASNTRGWPFAALFRAWFGPATSRAWDELHSEWGTSDSGR